MASPVYAYVSSDNVLQPLSGEQDFSSSASPTAMDTYTPNVNSNENYVPWFIDTDNMETNVTSQPEPIGDFSTCLEDAEWDYQQSPTFPTSDNIYNSTAGNIEPWSNTFPQQYFTISPENTLGFLGGDYTPPYLDVSQQQPLETSAAQNTVKKATRSISPRNKPRSPKRRRSSTTSPSSPTEDYRKGHNAIEKRYRSNLNSKILSLEQCLPAQETPGNENEAGPARKTKSAILTRAVKHIEFLKQTTQRLAQETEDLNCKFNALEKIAMRSLVVEVADAEVDIEDQEETLVELEEHLSAETDVETAILNSKLLTRRRLRRGNS